MKRDQTGREGDQQAVVFSDQIEKTMNFGVFSFPGSEELRLMVQKTAVMGLILSNRNIMKYPAMALLCFCDLLTFKGPENMSEHVPAQSAVLKNIWIF